MQKKFETKIQIRPSDLDLNYHVHYPKYLEYILLARIDQLSRCYNYSMEKFFQQGYSWVVKTTNLNFKVPVMLSDDISVYTWTVTMDDIDCKIGVEIIKNRNLKIALDGYILFSLVDLKNGEMCPIPTEIREHFMSFKEDSQ